MTSEHNDVKLTNIDNDEAGVYGIQGTVHRTLSTISNPKVRRKNTLNEEEYFLQRLELTEKILNVTQGHGTGVPIIPNKQSQHDDNERIEEEEIEFFPDDSTESEDSDVDDDDSVQFVKQPKKKLQYRRPTGAALSRRPTRESKFAKSDPDEEENPPAKISENSMMRVLGGDEPTVGAVDSSYKQLITGKLDDELAGTDVEDNASQKSSRSVTRIISNRMAAIDITAEEPQPSQSRLKRHKDIIADGDTAHDFHPEVIKHSLREIEQTKKELFPKKKLLKLKLKRGRKTVPERGDERISKTRSMMSNTSHRSKCTIF